jgi:hypothetical protein
MIGLLKDKKTRTLLRNKRGQMSILEIFLIVGLLLFSILIFVAGVTIMKINNALNQDIDLGQVNLANVSSQTFGKYAQMFLNNADWWGISLIFGTILGIFASAYILRNTVPKWGIIIDIFIILAMFFVSLYVSSTYKILLDSFASAGETFLEDYTPRTSMFLINLPIYIVIVGVIAMVLFHSSIPRKQEEIYQSGGYLQGAY